MERKQAEELQEELLDGWLQMSTVICNERLVSAMTYNESMVCGVLYRNRQKCVTATDLCAKLRILKPQMNAILNGLQNRRHAGADPFGSGPPSGVPSAYEGRMCVL